MEFRLLRADEIDVRVQQITEKGAILLLYKDARCDMNILDETVGSMNWQRHHSRENANCTVSIWDDEKKQWIEKEDTGKESFTEAEKGLASDSFKRACFNWGIGRELYTAPFIFVNASEINMKDKSGKKITYDKFFVDKIEYKDKVIENLAIKNQDGKLVFVYCPSQKKKAKKEEPPKEYKCCDCGKPFEDFIDKNGKKWTAGQLYHMSEKSNSDGKARCRDCRLKYEKEKANAEH